jgi:hypothetical protein
MADFVAAYVESIDKDAKIEIVGRCLIVSCASAWNEITTFLEPHILIADFDLDNDTGTRLLNKACRARHAVIFRGPPGGIPHPIRAALLSPRSKHIQDALKNQAIIESELEPLRRKAMVI